MTHFRQVLASNGGKRTALSPARDYPLTKLYITRTITQDNQSTIIGLGKGEKRKGWQNLVNLGFFSGVAQICRELTE
jgi:hypothetical protein